MENAYSDTSNQLNIVLLVFAFLVCVWAIIIVSWDTVEAYFDGKEQAKTEEIQRRRRGKITPRHLDNHDVRGYQVRI